MQLFYHHIYELQKGLRNLAFCTEKLSDITKIEDKLQREKIPYLIHKIPDNKINVYFGDQTCINVVKTFKTEKLNELSDQEDFILGIMLGYDRLQQCIRYLKRK